MPLTRSQRAAGVRDVEHAPQDRVLAQRAPSRKAQKAKERAALPDLTALSPLERLPGCVLDLILSQLRGRDLLSRAGQQAHAHDHPVPGGVLAAEPRCEVSLCC